MGRTYGPWTAEKRNRLANDVQRYFRVYYRELSNRVRAHDRGPGPVLPHWLRGGRRIEVSGCADGVVIAHNYHRDADRMDPASRTDNEFAYYLPHTQLAKDIAANYIPPRPGGEVQVSPADLGFPDYEPGQSFGAHCYLSPAQITHAFSEDMEIVEEVHWLRFDIVDMENLHIWRDRSRAPREARDAVQVALERIESENE